MRKVRRRPMIFKGEPPKSSPVSGLPRSILKNLAKG